jgi:hypothetical protein
MAKCADDPRRWILIDWDDAASLPTHAAHHLNKHYHAPTVFEDGHGAEVDLWGVGQLIVESSRFFPSFPSNILAAGKAMKSGEWNVSQSIKEILSFKTLIKGK